MSEQFKIAGHRVTGITRETAQVGCTKVTRADVEKLLKEMDAAKKVYDFEIEPIERNSGDYINFNIRHAGSGWLAASSDPNASRTGFSYASAFFCLDRKKAEKLLNFLSEQLRGTIGKYVVEFSQDGCPWARSGNIRARDAYSFVEATRIAADQEKTMGSGYRYRAVPA